MAAFNGLRAVSGSSPTTPADTVAFTRPVSEVRMFNYHATQGVWVRVSTGKSAAEALANATSNPVTAAGTDAIYVGPGPTPEQSVFRSAGDAFVCLSVIGTGAATTWNAVAT